MKLHLCCNQLEYKWEIRNSREQVLFQGTLSDMELLLNDLNHQDIEEFRNID